MRLTWRRGWFDTSSQLNDGLPDHFSASLAARSVERPHAPLADLLGLGGRIDWRCVHSGTAIRHDRATLRLPDLAAGHCLVPSYSRRGGGCGYRFTLGYRAAAGGAGCAALASVGALITPAAACGSVEVDAPIDAFETREQLRDVVLTLDRFTPATALPDAPEWLSCSLRPQRSTPAPGTLIGNSVYEPAAFSQLQTGHPDCARICSPVCVAMAIAAHVPGLHPLDLLAASLHSGIYGVWPANIHAASGLGLLGAVELFSHLDEVLPLLRAGVHVIASTRWCPGELDGAALPQSGGHLMLLRGVDAQSVWVHDPAAASDAEVSRRYRRDQFCTIWLAARGAAYLLLPPPAVGHPPPS